MKTFQLISAVFAVVFGAFMLIAPNAFVKLNRALSRYIPVESSIFHRRIKWGITLVILGGIFMILAISYWQ